MQTRLTHVNPRAALVNLVVDMDLCRTFSAVDLLRARSTAASAAGLQLQNLYRRSRGCSRTSRTGIETKTQASKANINEGILRVQADATSSTRFE